MSKLPQQRPPGKKPGRIPRPQQPEFNYRPWLWYASIALLLLWIWQDFFSAIIVHTIPYSEFKQYVAKKQVVECQIQENEVLGVVNTKIDHPAPEVGERDTGESRVLTSDSSSQSKTASKSATEASKSPESPPTEIAEPPPGGDTTSQPTKSLEQQEKEAKRGEKFYFRAVRVEDPTLVEELQAAGAEFVGVRPSLISQFLLSWVLPLGIMFLLWNFLSRRMAAVGQGVMGIGKSRAKLVADQETGVTFKDVAGCDEAKYELQEVVDFLQNPTRYTKLGAKIPKGVLLVGPPGTGKTLLARAVAGEAKVPFFSLSGSDFVEMFVGVGAARVRDLFEQATQSAPCIVFIDELDAIGRQRGVHVGAVNDEREQTLNQLLVEMDGFEANVGVILLAATNRPEVLDRALLRPGRFDRQVVVDAPDIDGREAILKVHSRDKPLDADVNLRKIAQGTPGFSGADLANVMNEAALLSARRHANAIRQQDIEDAVEKVVAGPERKSRLLEPDEKERVAYHEVGHALVGTYSEHADPVHKISIVPRGRAALGYTLQIPTGEQFLLTRSELFDRLKGLLGGRAAEDIKYGEVSTGAENDLERATAIARQMVCMYGMSDKVGLVHCARRENMYLPDSGGNLDCSQTTAHQIDEEVKLLLDRAYSGATQILQDHLEQLDIVAQELLVKETLDAPTFHALIGR